MNERGCPPNIINRLKPFFDYTFVVTAINAKKQGTHKHEVVIFLDTILVKL